MRTTFKVPDDTWRAYKVKTFKEGKKAGETIVKLINGFLAGEFDV